MRDAKQSSTKNAPAPLVDKVLKAKREKAIATYRGARDAGSSRWDDRYEAVGNIIEADPPWGFKPRPSRDAARRLLGQARRIGRPSP